IGVEDEELGAELHGSDQDLLELAAAEEVLGIRLAALLLDDLEDLDAGGTRQLQELGDPAAIVLAPAQAHRDDDAAALPLAGGGEALALARELRLQRADELDEIDVDVVRRPRRQNSPWLGCRAAAFRHEVRHVDQAGPPTTLDPHGGDEVEPEQ